jgi:arabinofuranosyltransferase
LSVETAPARRFSALRLLGAASPLLLFALVAALDTDLVDDAYIFCRYADNIVAGHGPVFNLGQKVEGFTSPLHLALMSAAAALGVPAPAAARAVSLGAAVLLLLVLVVAGDGPYSRDRGSGPLAAIMVVSSLPFVAWAASGMDVLLFALTVTVVALLAERWVAEGSAFGKQRRAAVYGSLVFLSAGGAFWVRPEGALLLGGVLLLAVAGSSAARSRRLFGLWVALGALPVGLLTLGRRLYYGSWLPNTYYAKMGGGGPALWGRGAAYLGQALLALLPLCAAVVLAWLYWWRRTRGEGGAARPLRREPTVIFLFVLGGAIVVEGGDFFAFHRFAVPLIPLMALLGVRLGSRTLQRPGHRLLATACIAALLLGWGWAGGPPTFDAAVPTQRERFASEVAFTRLFERVGRELRRALGASQRLAILTAGAIPYRTGWETIDMLGLVDTAIARRRSALGQGTIGHEKFDSRYLLSREPSIVVLHPWFWRRPVSRARLLKSRFLQRAQRDLVSQPAFARRYRMRWVRSKPGYLVVFQRSAGQ